MPGPERTWMLLAMTRLPSTKSLLSQTSIRSGGEMAAQSPSTRETKRISPEEALPACGALAEGWVRTGVEPAATCIRVSALAEEVAIAIHASRTKQEAKEIFMVGSVAAERGGFN
jgi:hypothetical protein